MAARVSATDAVDADEPSAIPMFPARPSALRASRHVEPRVPIEEPGRLEHEPGPLSRHNRPVFRPGDGGDRPRRRKSRTVDGPDLREAGHRCPGGWQARALIASVRPRDLAGK